MATAEKEKATEETEQQRVNRHREHFFRQVLGDDWPQEDLDVLVASKASPHDAEALKDRGCPLGLIVKILA